MSGVTESPPKPQIVVKPQTRTVRIADPSKKSKNRSRKRRSTRGKSISRKNKHKRQLSRAHHTTVQSLAQINAPMMRSLGQTSMDLKITHELRKALVELRRKEEDYRTAMEIGESLALENNQLRNQIQFCQNQFQSQLRDNQYMREKLETVEHSYHSDLHKYEMERENGRRLIVELEEKLGQQHLLLQQFKMQSSQSNDDQYQNGVTNGSHSDGNRKQSNSLNIAKLHRELENEKVRNMEKQKTIEDFMEKYDVLLQTKMKFEQMKHDFTEYQNGAHVQMQEQVAIQTAMQNEVIFVSSRNANLEEEKAELVALIDQRDYEITMLGQQLKLIERKAESTAIHSNRQYSASEHNLLSDINMDMIPSGDELDVELDIIEGYLENEHLFSDDDYFDVEDEEYYEDEVVNTPLSKSESQSVDGPPITNDNKNKKTDDERAYDKIREFLHLTASAVKIKYPTVLNIKSHELIAQVSNLPFHKFHDAMSRTMDSELKKMRVAADLANNTLSSNTKHSRTHSGSKLRNIRRSNSSSQLLRPKSTRPHGSSDSAVDKEKDVQPPTITKRASFFSLFFGSGKEDSSNNNSSSSKKRSKETNSKKKKKKKTRK